MSVSPGVLSATQEGIDAERIMAFRALHLAVLCLQTNRLPNAVSHCAFALSCSHSLKPYELRWIYECVGYALQEYTR